MARVKIPYLVVKRGAAGALPRYFWQPAAALRAQGWRAQRVPAGWAGYTEPHALEAAAIAAARDLNAEIEAWRIAHPAAAPAAPRVSPGTLKSAIAGYKASRFFLDKQETTQRVYRQNLSLLEEWAGDRAVRLLTEKDVQGLYTSFRARTPTRARHLVIQLQTVLKFCLSENLVARNVADSAGLVGAAPSGLVWPREAVTLFVATADALGYPGVGTAILFNDWLGQRETDILALILPRIEDGALTLRQNKTGRSVKLPIAIVPHLVARLEAEKQRRASQTVRPIDEDRRPFILSRTGMPYLERNFWRDFANIRSAVAALRAEANDGRATFPVDYEAAGVVGGELPVERLIFRHLRHTAVVRLAEAGATDVEISGVTGHTLGSIKTILERYLVRTGELARNAFERRLAKERGE